MSQKIARTLPIQMSEAEAREIHDAYVAAVHKHFQELAQRGTPADLSAYETPKKGEWAIRMIMLGIEFQASLDEATAQDEAKNQ